MIKLVMTLMDVSGPLSHKVLQLLADGNEYTEKDLIEKDKMLQRFIISPTISHIIKKFFENNDEIYSIRQIASFHGRKIKPIDPGNLSKTVKNLWGLGLVCHKLVIRAGEESHYYFLKWPDSYYIIYNRIEFLEKEYSREIEALNGEDEKSLKAYKNIDKKIDLCRQTLYTFDFWIKEFEEKEER